MYQAINVWQQKEAGKRNWEFVIEYEERLRCVCKNKFLIFQLNVKLKFPQISRHFNIKIYLKFIPSLLVLNKTLKQIN